MKKETYSLKKLIPGARMGRPGDLVVAVPDTGFSVVACNGKRMSIKGLKPFAYRRQKDQFGRGTFLLAYYVWDPEEKI